MYYALYRKYRPVDFDSVVGQDSIVKTLKNSIINKNFSHAYMFFGSRGTGKTSLSKIFARNINCLSPIDGNACMKCDSCKKSFDKNCIDIIEIDAASNNGVDEIRELKNNVNFAPSELKYKVYIIDEVHMLSSGAFNALLKTLEEPPAHVIFILATTDPQKVPETIVSRCQCFSFKKISYKNIKEKLKDICIKEKIKIDEEVLDKISLLSDGGLRDALGMLDKMISYSNDKISIDDFNELNGIISDDDLNDFINHILSGNIELFLIDIDNYNSCGKNLLQIIIQLINYLRDLIVDYYLDKKNFDFSLELLQSFINLLNEKFYDIKRSSNTKIYFEMLVLKFIDDYCLKNNLSGSDLNNNDLNVANNGDNSVVSSNDVIMTDDDEKINESFININSNNENIHKIKNINEIINSRINNTMATASKDLLHEEAEKFKLLSDYSFDQKIGAIVNNILDSKIRACGKNNFIISYPSDAVVQQNLDNIILLNDTYNNVTNSDKKIAIVSDKKWDEIKKEYIHNLKNNISYNLCDEPEVLFEEIKNNDIITSSAVSLFGEDIVEID